MPRILVVDDLPSARKVLSSLLRRIGYSKLVEAPNGHEGLLLAEQDKFDVIISDWRMPKLDGIEFLSRLRNGAGASKDTPFLIVTSTTDREDVVSAINAGVADYLCKPFAMQALRGKLELIFRKSGVSDFIRGGDQSAPGERDTQPRG